MKCHSGQVNRNENTYIALQYASRNPYEVKYTHSYEKPF